MGQKANPTGNRLGIIRGWDSAWFGGKHYAEKLIEDERIRKYLNARLQKSSIARIVIERTQKLVTVTIHSARPGIIIGKGGSEVDKLKEELKKINSSFTNLSMDVMGRSFDGTEKKMLPNSTVMELKMGTMTIFKQVFNGTSGYQQQGPQKKDLDEEETKEMKDEKGTVKLPALR